MPHRIMGDKNGPRATRLLHLFTNTDKGGCEGFDFRHFISKRVTRVDTRKFQ